jgi:GNAT superfamily N-acetyltransferase
VRLRNWRGGSARDRTLKSQRTYAERVTDFTIRAARPEEADELGELAFRSKAYWGYDAEFMEACREELKVPADQVVARRVYVAVSRGSDADPAAAREGRQRILGFGTVEGEPPAGELGMLFVDPSAIGRGVGSALISHLTAVASRLGFHRLTIAADPNAEPFYLAKGAVRIGGVPSGSVPGRTLPLLALAL